MDETNKSYSIGRSFCGDPNYSIISAEKVAEWRNLLAKNELPKGFFLKPAYDKPEYFLPANIDESKGYTLYYKDPFGNLEKFAILKKDEEGKMFWELMVTDARCDKAPALMAAQIPQIGGIPTRDAPYTIKNFEERWGAVDKLDEIMESLRKDDEQLGQPGDDGAI